MIMTNAVFFDIDGTLVSFKTHRMPESTVETLEELRKKGIKLFVASGRHITSINNLGEWKPDGYVTVNGGMCWIDGKLIYEHYIAQPDIISLIDYLENEESFPCVFVLKNELCMNFGNELTDKVFGMLNFAKPRICNLRHAENEKVYQILAFFDPEQEKRAMCAMPNSEPTRWTSFFADIIPAGSSKWTGIEKILEYSGIDRSETMAFGDGGNDIDMLQNAATGVAMGNADNRVKEIADYITDTVENEGIKKAFRHFGII